MLYPIQGKGRKMERDELSGLVSRLYQVKPKESELVNVRNKEIE